MTTAKKGPAPKKTEGLLGATEAKPPAAPKIDHLFPTQEIGSIARIGWRTKVLGKQPIKPDDLKEAESWGKKLGIENLNELLAFLKKGHFSDDDKHTVRRWAAKFGIRYLEHTGLDLVYDGEQQRSEMYEYPIRRTTGFEFKGWVRSFDNRYYQKAAVVESPRVATPWHDDEFKFIASYAKRTPKVPITGAYTLVDWSYDEHYIKHAKRNGLTPRQRARGARREFLLDVAKNVVRPNIQSLVKAGAKYVQIDEPAATSHPDEVDLFVESFNESVAGVSGAKFSVHICFSDYNLLFPHVTKLKNCSQYAFEFANKDHDGLGTTREARPGYSYLDLFREHLPDAEVGLGVVDIHSDKLETPELVRDRILYAAKTLKDPKLVWVNPDCGLRTRSLEVAERKLRVTVEGAKLARAALEGAKR